MELDGGRETDGSRENEVVSVAPSSENTTASADNSSPLAWVSRKAVVFPGSEIGGKSFVSDFTIVGHPSRSSTQEVLGPEAESLEFASMEELAISSGFSAGTAIGKCSEVRSFCVIYEDVCIGERLDMAHFVTIREGSRIGSDVYLKVGADIRRNVRVGDGTTIAGLIGDRAVVGNGATILGDLVHRSTGPHRGEIEPAPKVEDDVFVGRNTTVVGDVRIGKGAYLATGITVRRDVEAGALIKTDHV